MPQSGSPADWILISKSIPTDIICFRMIRAIKNRCKEFIFLQTGLKLLLFSWSVSTSLAIQYRCYTMQKNTELVFIKSTVCDYYLLNNAI